MVRLKFFNSTKRIQLFLCPHIGQQVKRHSGSVLSEVATLSCRTPAVPGSFREIYQVSHILFLRAV